MSSTYWNSQVVSLPIGLIDVSSSAAGRSDVRRRTRNRSRPAAPSWTVVAVPFSVPACWSPRRGSRTSCSAVRPEMSASATHVAVAGAQVGGRATDGHHVRAGETASTGSPCHRRTGTDKLVSLPNGLIEASSSAVAGSDVRRRLGIDRSRAERREGRIAAVGRAVGVGRDHAEVVKSCSASAR